MDSTREIVVSCHRNSEEVSMSTVSAGLSEKTLQPKTVILAAEARLRRSSFPELRLVFCTFHHGILTLTGGYRAGTCSSLLQQSLKDCMGLRRSTTNWWW